MRPLDIEKQTAFERLEKAIANDFMSRYGLGPNRSVEFTVWVRDIAERNYPLLQDDVVLAYENNRVIEGWAFEQVNTRRDETGQVYQSIMRGYRLDGRERPVYRKWLPHWWRDRPE